MTTFLISYDLAAPQSNKHALASAIMMLGQSWARPLAQTWYIRTDLACQDIEAVLSGLLEDDDGLLVQGVETDAVLANTSLRWFRQRRPNGLSVATPNNVVAFPPAPVEQADIAAFDVPFAEAS